MAGFRFSKAKAEQAAIKMGLYGPAGSGKTFTALLCAEGLARITGKRIAFIDTEHGTDFYCQHVKARAIHPEAFDFDAIYTRSLTEADEAVRAISPDEHCCVVIDSVTHFWEAAMDSYTGKRTSIGTIPVSAWGKVKKPYKRLMQFLLSSPMHIIICGRQKNEYATDEETEELKMVGVTMRAEGETPYEPHILIRMEGERPKKGAEVARIIAFAEKDRTGVLAGRLIINPTFESLCLPILPLLGTVQAHVDGEQSIVIDAEKLTEQEREREVNSVAKLKEICAKIDLAETPEELKKVGESITPDLKAQMTVADVASMREHYQDRSAELKPKAKKAA